MTTVWAAARAAQPAGNQGRGPVGLEPTFTETSPSSTLSSSLIPHPMESTAGGDEWVEPSKGHGEDDILTSK